MKFLKKGLLTLVLSFFVINSIQAQDDNPTTMFNVHVDNVKFAMVPQYEAAAKELKENFVKHNIQDVNWTAISLADGRYVYVSPLKNMAELDNPGFAQIFEKMGKDEAGALFDKMDECYDSHGNTISHYVPELSYHPEGYSTEDKNFREYHFLYYAPRDAKAMNEAMKAVKDMFAAKGVKNGYDVIHSGFGDDESYYMVAISGKDDLAIAQGGKDNDELLGDAKGPTFFNVIKLTTKYDMVEGRVRPDLSYYPKKE
ncbi:hypothetical protein [Ichthyenterobacterium magnum]|uniref:Uncharacterized protein n=1 Tax=Ichthyenterobacterium magnum TaxID=1230530 RepID=A0A420DKC2_9FLAO|nr:hypothetical protein [Ichthyenterobacterium magnum]RKE94693.1 hypothetical protein BXY80_1703 [Ichthyenterobacterium magnum]